MNELLVLKVYRLMFSSAEVSQSSAVAEKLAKLTTMYTVKTLIERVSQIFESTSRFLS